MASITIFQTESLNEIPKAKTTIKKIRKTHTVNIKKEHESAVIGELAGMATEILMSPIVQTPLTILGLIELGKNGWKLIKKVHRTDKVCHINKEFASALVIAKALKIYKKYHPKEYKALSPDDIKTIGIMDAAPMSKKLINTCYKNFNDEGRDVVYFMGVVIKKAPRRSLTLWYIIRADGKICSAWSTQTLTERLPREYR